jgi:exopolysaccharide production protein ExoZ
MNIEGAATRVIQGGAAAKASGSPGEPRHYAFLDALRGIAATGVVAVHTAQNFPPPVLRSVIGFGAYGVQLFYIVSAFSLCLSLDQRRRQEHRPLLNFALRRFFRIAPLFYVAMAVYLLKPFVLPAAAAPIILDPHSWSLRPWHVLVTLLFLNGWHYQTINSIVPGGWSVAVETNFYIVLPLLFALASSFRRALCLFVGSLAFSIVCRKALYLVFAPHVPPIEEGAFGVFASLWLPAQLPVFALGILMFRVVDTTALNGADVNRRGRMRLWLWTIALVVSVLAISFAPARFGKIVSASTQVSVAFFFACLIIAERPIRLLVNRVTVFVGKISYSIYLLHFVALHLVIWLTRSWYTPKFGSAPGFFIAFPIVFGLTWIMARATFQFVERPGQALGRRIIAHLESRGARVTVEPSRGATV